MVILFYMNLEYFKHRNGYFYPYKESNFKGISDRNFRCIEFCKIDNVFQITNFQNFSIDNLKDKTFCKRVSKSEFFDTLKSFIREELDWIQNAEFYSCEGLYSIYTYKDSIYRRYNILRNEIESAIISNPYEQLYKVNKDLFLKTIYSTYNEWYTRIIYGYYKNIYNEIF